MENRTSTVVLVADDEPSVLAMVSSHLQAKGFTVLEASDGDQAWELAREHLPHLVVLDVMMPGMSGWEVCRKIREAVSLAHTGVVMLTGIGENLNEMTSPLYGADAHVDKPFEFTELDEKIAETLERRSAGAVGRADGDEESAEPPTAKRGKARRENVERPTMPAAALPAKPTRARGGAKTPATPKPPVKARPGKKLGRYASAFSADDGETSALGPPERARSARKSAVSRASAKNPPLPAAGAKNRAARSKKAPAKTIAKHKAFPKKSVSTKTLVKKISKKAMAKKTGSKKAAAKSAAPKKAAAKKAAKKAPAKKGAKKAVAKKATKKAAKKAPAKKAPSNKAPARKAPAKKTAAKKAAPKTAAKKAPAKKTRVSADSAATKKEEAKRALVAEMMESPATPARGRKKAKAAPPPAPEPEDAPELEEEEDDEEDYEDDDDGASEGDDDDDDDEGDEALEGAELDDEDSDSPAPAKKGRKANAERS